MTIENATVSDSSLIADAILEAVGEEIATGLAGECHSRKDVHDIFQRLAEREDSQYSYINSRIARDEDGSAMGVCISYDGARLIELRRAFFQEAIKTLGWSINEEEIDQLPGETSSDEYYLDTLMTLPEHRGRGVGKALILDAAEKARKTGKPLGLLCDIDNDRARRLYDSIGFRFKDRRPFAGHEMNHLQFSFK